MRYADDKCRYTESFEGGQHYYNYTGPCFHTGKPYTVKIKSEELFALRQGAHIQDALKSVSVDDREFLMSGYSPEGWQQLFGEPEPATPFQQGYSAYVDSARVDLNDPEPVCPYADGTPESEAWKDGYSEAVQDD